MNLSTTLLIVIILGALIGALIAYIIYLNIKISKQTTEIIRKDKIIINLKSRIEIDQIP